MLKNMIALALSVVTLLCLVSCSQPQENNPEVPEVSVIPADISKETTDFTKKLIPLVYQDGEEMESPYYRIVSDDEDNMCYEVQVEGESDPIQIPIDSVIYIVSDPADCRLEKVSFEYTPADGEPETIEQYRIFTTSSNDIPAGEEMEDIAEDTEQPVQESTTVESAEPQESPAATAETEE